MSEAGGQRDAKMKKDVLISISNDAFFATFYQTVLRKKKKKNSSFHHRTLSIKFWGWNWDIFIPCDSLGNISKNLVEALDLMCQLSKNVLNNKVLEHISIWRLFW